MSEYMQMYMEELSLILPCGEEEERRLLEAIAEGDKEAKSRMVEGMLPLSFEIARQYEKEGVYLEDLVQEANMALMQFVDCYEEGDFREQLKTEIHRALQEYMEQEEIEDKIEEEMTARANVLSEVSRIMAEDLGREATLEELSEKMKMEPDEIREIMKMTVNAVTVDGR